jgi:energy-coupling factor transport system permease protein
MLLCAPRRELELLFVFLVLLLLINARNVKALLSFTVVYLLLTSADLMLIPQLDGFWGMFALTIVRVPKLFIPIIAVFAYVVRSTTVSEFVAVFRKMKISDVIIIPFTVMFRFFPTIVENRRNVKNAMRFRGIQGNVLSNLFHPLVALEYMVVPLLMSSVKIADDLTAASLSRGLSIGGQRSCYQQIKFGCADVVVTLISLGFIGAAVYI